jgi:hypothetical protein
VTQRLLVRDEIAAFLLLALYDDFDNVANSNLDGAGVVEHRVERNQAFGLQADVDDDMLVGDLDDGASDDGLIGGQCLGGVLLSGLLAVEALECLGEIFIAVLGLGVRSSSLDLRYRIGGGVLRGGTEGFGVADDRRGLGGHFRGRKVRGNFGGLRSCGGLFGGGCFECRVQGFALWLERNLVDVGHR